MKPLKLQSPRVWRTYTGGKLLDRWHKKEPQTDTQFPEEWIASTIAARNPGRENLCEGLSIAEGVPLKERIASSPERYLGAAHYKRYGVSTGILIKMLDAAERLTIQVHPDQAAARALFSSPYGKTESWYVAATRGPSACIYLGFRPGITRARWQSLFQKQAIDEMLFCLNQIFVSPGDVFLVPGGVPHAIGEGCCMLELQEPTDYTIRTERVTPGGLPVDDFLCHQGLGFDRMFSCFHYEGYGLEEILSRWRLRTRGASAADRESVCIGREDTPCFSLHELLVKTSLTLQAVSSFSVLVVLRGQGKLLFDEGSMSITQGDSIFLPAACLDMHLEAQGDQLHVLRCLPPEAKPL